MSFLQRSHAIINSNLETNKYSKLYNLFSSTLIVISIILIILESFKELKDAF